MTYIDPKYDFAASKSFFNRQHDFAVLLRGSVETGQGGKKETANSEAHQQLRVAK